MQYHVHEKRYYGGSHGSCKNNSHSSGSYGGYEALQGLDHFSGFAQGVSGSEQLVHQEFDELHHFAPLTRDNSLRARRSGTRLTTAMKKLSGLVRYVYLSLF